MLQTLKDNCCLNRWFSYVMLHGFINYSKSDA
uniref:Uncharacterized protein n=1 Tax=Rhizophora mucronata TaxID=61149 RepID=A0A2P2P4P4_RHIMU